MPYSILDDLKKQIPEQTIIDLTDDSGVGIIDEDIAERCRQQGEDLIDSYCGQVASVPFATVPGVIKSHSLTLWIYFLYTRRSIAPELVRKNYEDAISHLKDISTGKAALPPIGASEVSGGDEVSFKSERRIFTRKKMKGF